MYKSFFLLFLFLVGCKKYDLSVSQHLINREYLASTHVGTPDPCQECPPTGDMLSVEWVIPRELLGENPEVVLHILFKNYTEETLYFPIKERASYVTYYLLDDDYEEKEGIFAYKAEIVTEDGEIYREWKHQLWVNLITLEEMEEESTEQSNSCVSDQPMQESVMETP